MEAQYLPILNFAGEWRCRLCHDGARELGSSNEGTVGDGPLIAGWSTINVCGAELIATITDGESIPPPIIANWLVSTLARLAKDGLALSALGTPYWESKAVRCSPLASPAYCCNLTAYQLSRQEAQSTLLASNCASSNPSLAMLVS